MTNRAELLEAALDSRSDGIALLGNDSEVVFWNRAAEAITGYSGVELLSLPIPSPLEPLLLDVVLEIECLLGPAPPSNRGAVVQIQHKMGHTVQAIVRRTVLRDGLGERIGTAIAFHPAESLDALPHGDLGEDPAAEEDCAEFEERLQTAFDDSTRGGPPIGVLWVGVDQAEDLHRTHGVGAYHQMLGKIRHALAQGLRPGEEMGRWGDDEFLILAHERSAEMLAVHAQNLAGLARTADFRWWGDRVSLTVSIGAAQAAGDGAETLAQLLERARQAMEASVHHGGNRATVAAGSSAQPAPAKETTCLPS